MLVCSILSIVLKPIAPIASLAFPSITAIINAATSSGSGNGAGGQKVSRANAAATRIACQHPLHYQARGKERLSRPLQPSNGVKSGRVGGLRA